MVQYADADHARVVAQTRCPAPRLSELCPGCVAHGTPHVQRAHALFRNSDLYVVGLHTVFKYHAAMTPVSLEAFIDEYRLTFPIGLN